MEPRILIADDDSVLLDLMMRRLHRLGHNAERAENGSYALEMMEHAYYDLIITDIYMPGKTGLDVLEQALKKDPKAVVLIVTGGATIEKALAALDQGAYFYLTKPFDHLSVFDFMVKRALEYRRLIFGEVEGSLPVSASTAGTGFDGSSEERLLSRAQLFDILENYPKGVVVLGPDGEMMLCNPCAQALMDDFWGGVDGALEDLRSRNGSLTGGGYVHLASRSMKIRADRFSIGMGKACTLYSLDDYEDPVRPFSGMLQVPMDYLKKALAWLFSQKMTDQEFQVIRSMAQQVARIDSLKEEYLVEN